MYIMSKLFGKNNQSNPMTKRELYERNYNNGITNLLLVVAFSVINIVLLVTNADTYFLFSAFVPYCFVDLGMYYTGMYPEEYYYGIDSAEFLDKSFLAVTVVIAAVVVLLYLLCWFFAKKKKIGWVIFAVVMACIDTVAMLIFWGIQLDTLVDIIFHAWIIFSLVNAVVTYNKLKKLPEEAVEVIPEENAQILQNSTVLRMADTEEKARTLLEAEENGYHVVYRRIKRINELIVNGRVYDEYVALIEKPHTLTAIVDGHRIEMQYDMASRMYLLFDGRVLAEKFRII